MKKSFILFVTSLLALAGCTRNQEIDIPEANLSLFARTESPAESKTIVESGVHVYWEPGDEIAVFMGEKSAKFTTDITASSATATFKGTFGDTTWPEELDLWAVYPYSEDAVFDGETITTTLPSEQIAREGSFGKDMNLAVAHSTSNTLQFYNVGGGIRFSVTEEGIKKVMFEGLSGEIISGKVKIGLDENGLPIVQDISGGSQFITLLPPAGKETFEKDVWYYIVAIPGALESGYKLRFYKDSDYARKVSEKTVEIKRSIFGSIDKADSGIEYEALITHFPETEEEISKSVDLTYEIGDKVSVILGTTYDKNAENLEEVALEMEKVAGVQRVDILSTRKTIAVMQRDSIWLNFFLDTDAFYENANEAGGTHPIEAGVQRVKSKMVNKASENYPEEKKFVLDVRKALVLQPFYTDVGGNEYDMLDAFFEVKHLKDDQCSLAHFKGDYLDDFDVILIETHGGTSYRMYDPKVGDGIGDKKETTSFSTHVLYSKELAKKLIKADSLSREQVAITFIEDPNGAYPSANDEKILLSPVFAMTPDFLEGADFNNTVVYLNTCHSGEQIGDRPYGDMVPAFLNKGAGIMAFNNDTVKQRASYYCAYNFFEMLAHGISFQDAYKSIITSYDVRLFCDTYWDYLKDDEDMTPEDQGYTCIYNRLLYKMNDDINAKHFFLFNSVPQLSSDDHGTLEWECSLDSFSTTWRIYTDPKYDLVVDFSVSYDIYVDRELYATVNDSSDKSVIYSTPGNYKWYVIANVTKHIPSVNSHGEEGYELVASYRSAEMDFTVTEEPHYTAPEAIDLGLPSGIKWASFNLGATRPEEYGDYFAWGETEPNKNSYNWSNYKWCDGTESTLTKYNTDSAYGIVDNKTVLDSEDDVTIVRLGDKWRMPHEAEWTELLDECTWTWTNRSNVEGILVTGKNGNSIFIPGAGGWDRTYYSNDSRGIYWSSSIDMLDPYQAWVISFDPDYVFDSDYLYMGTADRSHGLPVRPVYDDHEPIHMEKPEPVDLGLSSGIKWASFNLGASRPEEYGDYYAWGETEPYYELGYAQSDIPIWKEGKSAGYDWQSYKWCMGSEQSLTKYCAYSAYGFNGFSDGKEFLDLEDDAAHVTLGDKWRIPRWEDMEELCSECTIKWTALYGVYGIKAIGPNGNSIFIPAAGSRHGTSLDGVASECYYWTATHYVTYSPHQAYYYFFNYNGSFWSGGNRDCGFSIRPVYDHR